MATIGVSIRELPNYYPDTEEVYCVTVNGEKITTVVTKHAPTVDHWIDRVYTDYKDCIDSDKKKDCLNRFVVGFDVKWRPNFGVNDNPIATLQLCVGRKCLIFQILRSEEVPRSLHMFLQDENLRFVGVEIENAALKLKDDYNMCVEKTVDLGDLAALYLRKEELKTLGLMGLAKVVFRRGEIEIPANVTLSNWSQKFLTREQIQYACVDAYVSFKIGNRLGPYLWGPNADSCLALWNSCSKRSAEDTLKDAKERQSIHG